MKELEQFKKALIWALTSGARAIDYGTTGYNTAAGTDLMPPAEFHLALDFARNAVLAAEQARKS